MMKQLVIILLLFPFLVCAQTETKIPPDSVDKGISFQQDKTWKQILAKAKAERKYIFVDCYTTWCAPCKQMEKEVYPLDKVGALFNEKFISVKEQMDTSAKDDDRIKKQYADAHSLLAKYKLEGYPSYLFFTPDGKIIDRGIGVKSPEEFIAMGRNAADPEKNYYRILGEFEKGKRDMGEMSFLARRASLMGDTTNSKKLAREYITQLKNATLLTRDNIEFMSEFTKNSGDKGFSFFYDHENEIDSVIADDTYAQHFMQEIILKEMVTPETDNAKRMGTVPDWAAIQAHITSRYNNYYGERVMIAARASWGLHNHDDAEYTKYLVLYEDRYGSKTNTGAFASLDLNNYAWAVFQSSDNKAELERALSWSERAIILHPNAGWMDTYANILYKLGRKEDALLWEGIAAKLSPDQKYFQENIDKMKAGQATWGQNK